MYLSAVFTQTRAGRVKLNDLANKQNNGGNDYVDQTGQSLSCLHVPNLIVIAQIALCPQHHHGNLTE